METGICALFVPQVEVTLPFENGILVARDRDGTWRAYVFFSIRQARELFKRHEEGTPEDWRTNAAEMLAGTWLPQKSDRALVEVVGPAAATIHRAICETWSANGGVVRPVRTGACAFGFYVPKEPGVLDGVAAFFDGKKYRVHIFYSRQQARETVERYRLCLSAKDYERCRKAAEGCGLPEQSGRGGTEFDDFAALLVGLGMGFTALRRRKARN